MGFVQLNGWVCWMGYVGLNGSVCLMGYDGLHGWGIFDGVC